ncbi:MAG TPA: HAD-IIIA family hydrolase [Gemmatimonadales bacterium]|nr:HAD-IIIA family hydrolase [Gemmatimonadales bacterium]
MLMGTAAELRERYDLVIFDADDTLRRTTVPGQPCPRADDEWEFLPGRRELLSLLVSSEDVNVGIASNQDQVGHGLIAENTARALLAALLEQAGASTIDFDAIQLCPHPATLDCQCRKPAPGMLRRLMTHFAVRPARTLFIGDSPSDQEAAHRAGVNFRWAHDVFSDHQLANSD